MIENLDEEDWNSLFKNPYGLTKEEWDKEEAIRKEENKELDINMPYGDYLTKDFEISLRRQERIKDKELRWSMIPPVIIPHKLKPFADGIYEAERLIQKFSEKSGKPKNVMMQAIIIYCSTLYNLDVNVFRGLICKLTGIKRSSLTTKAEKLNSSFGLISLETGNKITGSSPFIQIIKK